MIKFKSIFAIFCHPDDVELSCFATLLKYKKLNCKIYILFLSKGTESFKSKNIDRTIFSKNALKNITKNVFFENFSDGKISYNNDLISTIDNYISKFKPECIVTHYTNLDGSSTHQDHHSCRLAVTNSARRSNDCKFLMYAEPEYNIKEFIPNFYVDVNSEFADKLKSLLNHKFENQKYYFSKDYVSLRAKWWYMQSGQFTRFNKYRYYEAFQIVFIRN